MLNTFKTALSLTLLLLGGASGRAAQLAADPCDTLVLSNQTVFTIKHLQVGKTGVTFSFCDDSLSVPREAPWMQIKEIRKADGTLLESPAQRPPAPPDDLEKLDVAADKVLGMSILSFTLLIVGIGVFLGAAAFFKALKLLKKAKGMPGANRIRRRLRWALFLSGLCWIPFVVIGVVMAVYFVEVLGSYNQQ